MPQNILDEALNDAENFDIKPDTNVKHEAEIKPEEDVKVEGDQSICFKTNLDDPISTSASAEVKEGKF